MHFFIANVLHISNYVFSVLLFSEKGMWQTGHFFEDKMFFGVIVSVQ